MPSETHGHSSGTAISAQSVSANGGTATADITTTGFLQLAVIVELAAGNAADLALAVRPYLPDGTTLHRQALPAAGSQAAALAAGTPDSAVIQQTFDLRGITKVQVLVTNSDAFAAKVATASYYLLD